MYNLKSKLLRNGDKHVGKGQQTSRSRNNSINKQYPDEPHSFETFKNLWKQAVEVMIKYDKNRVLSLDGVTSVVDHFGSMCDILVIEQEENKQQGPCLVYLLSEDILGQLIRWCISVEIYSDKVKYELLRKLDHLISHSTQPLLYHKPVIKALVTILTTCDDSQDQNIQQAVISLLHQLCVCISCNPQYIELFFNVSESANPHSFWIFCMLIPYIHYEGPLGQQTRDALLLIMAASSRNKLIGRYICNRSDFCPVLATGLSALYSTLPRKIRPDNHEEWYRIEIDQYLHVSAIQSIINCLEFCNAVIQVAHDFVGKELIKYIYHGFLVPVMAPALLQNSIEEQISAISYLELFVRTVTEPTLLRAFIYFILTTEHENAALLDMLIERISSSTKLCMVSLSLFRTLVDLNCEDIMYALCFRYLFRLTHVMQSQRRAVTQLDMYSKVAHTFLQLEPHCCCTELTSDQQQQLVRFGDGIFSGTNSRSNSHIDDNEQISIKKLKSDYHEYLMDAHLSITNCYSNTLMWTYPWDGANPPVDAAISTINTPLIDSLLYKSPVVSEDDVSLLGMDDDELVILPFENGDALLPELNCDHQTFIQPDASGLLIDISISDTHTLLTTQSVNPVLVQNNALKMQSKPMEQATCDESVKSKLGVSEDIETFYEYLDSKSDCNAHAHFSEEEWIRDVENAYNRSEITREVINTASEDEMDTVCDDSVEGIIHSNIGEVQKQLQDKMLSHSPETSLPRQVPLLERLDLYDNTPNIGPFLSTLLSKVEGMMNNSYSVNLLLTSLITRLACYPQPLLRSFLLNHHLVFQPTVKSLIQAIGTVKQKVDHHAKKIPNFPVLLMQARKLLIEDEDMYIDVQGRTDQRVRSESVMHSDPTTRSPARRLAEFFSPKRVQSKQPKRIPELVNEGDSYRFTNAKADRVTSETPQARLAKLNTKNAVYTALVLEEFVKEMAALAQEHLIHSASHDEGNTSSS